MILSDYWDSFKRLITPESHAEAVVNEIYGPDNKGMLGTPGYPPEPPFDSTYSRIPSVVAKPIMEIEIIGGKIASATENTAKKYLIYLFAGLIVLAAVYGFAGRR